MLQLIAFIIFLGSVLSIAFILFKKAPVLAGLPKNGHHGFKKPELVDKIHKKTKAWHFHFFEKQMLLHKLLSWTKIVTLKMERWLDHLLSGIRKKAQELDKQVKKGK